RGTTSAATTSIAPCTSSACTACCSPGDSSAHPRPVVDWRGCLLAGGREGPRRPAVGEQRLYVLLPHPPAVGLRLPRPCAGREDDLDAIAGIASTEEHQRAHLLRRHHCQIDRPREAAIALQVPEPAEELVDDAKRGEAAPDLREQLIDHLAPHE